MVPLKLSALFDYLKREEFDANWQPATHQIYIVVKKAGMDFPLFLKTGEDEKILQLIIFLPCSFRGRFQGEIGRLLHLINKEIDLPGFGMDEAAGVIFYRAVLPFPNGEVNTNLLKNMLLSLPHLAATFLPFIISTINGVSFEIVAGKIKEALIGLK